MASLWVIIQDRFIHKTFNNFVSIVYRREREREKHIEHALNSICMRRRGSSNWIERLCFDSPTAHSFIVMILFLVCVCVLYVLCDYLLVPIIKVDFIFSQIIAIAHKHTNNASNGEGERKKNGRMAWLWYCAHLSKDYKTPYGCVVVSGFLSVCDL